MKHGHTIAVSTKIFRAEGQFMPSADGYDMYMKVDHQVQGGLVHEIYK